MHIDMKYKSKECIVKMQESWLWVLSCGVTVTAGAVTTPPAVFLYAMVPCGEMPPSYGFLVMGGSEPQRSLLTGGAALDDLRTTELLPSTVLLGSWCAIQKVFSYIEYTVVGVWSKVLASPVDVNNVPLRHRDNMLSITAGALLRFASFFFFGWSSILYIFVPQQLNIDTRFPIWWRRFKTVPCRRKLSHYEQKVNQ